MTSSSSPNQLPQTLQATTPPFLTKGSSWWVATCKDSGGSLGDLREIREYGFISFSPSPIKVSPSILCWVWLYYPNSERSITCCPHFFLYICPYFIFFATSDLRVCYVNQAALIQTFQQSRTLSGWSWPETSPMFLLSPPPLL